MEYNLGEIGSSILMSSSNCSLFFNGYILNKSSNPILVEGFPAQQVLHILQQPVQEGKIYLISF